jgi:hypothetical protein
MKNIFIGLVVLLLIIVIMINLFNNNYKNKFLEPFDENIYLPVSLGEAIDKFTILDIKLEKITDKRKNDVQIEYDMLRDKLENYIEQYNDLYQSMKKVNTIIWDQMDILRDGDVDENTYLTTCKDCIEYNDIRFRIKNKINFASNSNLKEQKSYKSTRLFIEINPNIDNVDDFIKPIKYFSYFYDEILIMHSDNSKLKDAFEYDKTILFSKDKPETDFKKIYKFLNNSYDNMIILKEFDLTNEDLNKLM